MIKKNNTKIYKVIEAKDFFLDFRRRYDQAEYYISHFKKVEGVLFSSSAIVRSQIYSQSVIISLRISLYMVGVTKPTHSVGG